MSCPPRAKQTAPVTVYPLPEHGPDDSLASRTNDQGFLQLRLYPDMSTLVRLLLFLLLLLLLLPYEY